MSRRVPNGAYCVFRTPVEGSRNGRMLLVQHRSISDPDTGGSYTIKVYESTKTGAADGWRHEEIRLKPDTTAPGYEPIVLTGEDDGEVKVIAELIDVLPGPTG